MNLCVQSLCKSTLSWVYTGDPRQESLGSAVGSYLGFVELPRGAESWLRAHTAFLDYLSLQLQGT